MLSTYRPYFWNSQSLLSRGQTWRVLSHREMQWKWKACCGKGNVSAQDWSLYEDRRVGGGGKHTLQMPQATVHSSLVAEAWFA